MIITRVSSDDYSLKESVKQLLISVDIHGFKKHFLLKEEHYQRIMRIVHEAALEELKNTQNG